MKSRRLKNGKTDQVTQYLPFVWTVHGQFFVAKLLLFRFNATVLFENNAFHFSPNHNLSCDSPDLVVTFLSYD